MSKKFIYTQSAKERLEKLQVKVQDEIEKYLRDRKFVPGDDMIEITAADIDEIARLIKIERPEKLKQKSIIGILYIVLGLTILSYGVLYEDFITLLEKNPLRLVLIIIGFSTIAMSVIILYRSQIKAKYYEGDLNDRLRQLKKYQEDLHALQIEMAQQKNLHENKVQELKQSLEKNQPSITIHSAKYFSEQNYFNVTPKIRELVEAGILEFNVSNELMGGDPYVGKEKTLEIDCTINGVRKVLHAKERTSMTLS